MNFLTPNIFYFNYGNTDIFYLLVEVLIRPPLVKTSVNTSPIDWLVCSREKISSKVCTAQRLDKYLCSETV
jgi:hypothetical protein